MRVRSPHARTGTPLVVLAVALLLLGCAPQPPQRIVLIVADTLRADRLGIYGAEPTRAPEIDRRATAAAVFENALATSPWTLPTLGSVLTGRLPSAHGAGRRLPGGFWSKAPLDPTIPTLAEALAAAGYSTAAIVNNPFLRPRFGLARGFGSWDYGADRRADVVTDAAITWLEAHRDGPFFLLVHYMDPHQPYDPPAAVRGRFAGQVEGLEPGFRIEPVRRSLATLSAEQKGFIAGLYDEEVLFLDSQVARLLDALDATQPGNRTLVVLTADHGEEFFEHGGLEHGHALWQEVLHVPLVVWGGAVEPRRLAGAVSLVDLAATFAEAAGLAPSSFPGRSLWPTLTGRQADAIAQPLLAEGLLYGDERQAVVRWPMKLVLDPATGDRTLHDLETDPFETTDLAAERPDTTERLASLLAATLTREAATGQSGEAVDLDEETLKELRSLGYVN